MYHIILLLISTTLCISVNASNLNGNYDLIWKKYTKERKIFLSCKSPEETSRFLLNGMNLSGNTELEQAYNGTIGEGIINNPACVLNALIITPIEMQNKIINKYLARPLYKNISDIEQALNKAWHDNKYHNIKIEFLRLKKEIYGK